MLCRIGNEGRRAIADEEAGGSEIIALRFLFHKKFISGVTNFLPTKPFHLTMIVAKGRKLQKKLQDFEAAVEAAIQEMPEDFVIREFLIANRAEVRRMLLTEYDEEKVLAQERKETEIRTENKINERVATDMIRDGESLAKIKKYSKLPEATIRKLAESMGVAVL